MNIITLDEFNNKARILEDDQGRKLLISYDTVVCRIENGKFIRMWGGYSATTMRHVNAFCEHYGIDGFGKSWWDKQEVEKQ